MISEISPGRVESRSTGKETRWDTHDSEEGVLGRSEDGPEELLNVIHCKTRVTSGAQQNSSHVGNISWGRLGDIVEAEAGLGAHGAVRGHSNFGG